MTENKKQSRSFMVDLSADSKNPFSAVTVNKQPFEEDIVEEVDTNDEEDQLNDNIQNRTTDNVDENIQVETDSEEDEYVEQSEDEADESDDVEQTDDSEEGEEEQGDEDVNPYYYLHQQLKADGFISDEHDFDENVDGLSVYNAYKEKLREDLEPVVRQELNNRLAQAGYDEADLVYARAIRQGVDPRLLSTASAYETYASVPDDSPENDKVSVIQGMYKSRGFNHEEIENLIEVQREKGNIEDLFKQSKQYFAGKYSEFVEQERSRAAAAEQQARQEADKARNLINNIVSSRKVLDDEMTPAQAKMFKDAIYNETEVVELQGQRYKATPLQKFLLSFENDPEVKLYLFKHWMFREQEQDNAKKRAKQEVEEEFLKGYKTRIVKNKKATKNKNVKRKLETNKKITGNSYFIGFEPKE